MKEHGDICLQHNDNYNNSDGKSRQCKANEKEHNGMCYYCPNGFLEDSHRCILECPPWLPHKC